MFAGPKYFTSTRRAWAVLAFVALAFVATVPGAGAHALAPSLLELREQQGGEYTVRFKTPNKRAPGVDRDDCASQVLAFGTRLIESPPELPV